MAELVEVLELTSTAFRAMGTDVDVHVLEGADDDLHWAAAEVARLERLWSRFLPDSDISRVNDATGAAVEVAPETIVLVERALAAMEWSGGAFDPLLGGELAALGYDRSFDAIDVSGAGAEGPAVPRAVERGLVVDAHAGTVQVAAGRQLDVGGLAKGHAADLVVRGLLARGAAGACANLGGDLAIAGRAPHPSGWLVEVAHRASGAAERSPLALGRGGVATSTTLRRAWRGPAGDARHHLLDPTTAAPVAGALVEATVVAASAAEAEVLAKVAFVARGRLADLLRTAGAAALLTDRDGRTEQVGVLPWLA